MNLGALRSADYRRYFLSNVFALNGMWICRITIAWLAWDATGQAGFVGLVAFLIFAPTLVSGPFFGVLADRVPLKRGAIIAQSGITSAASALLLAAALDLLTPAVLAVLALVLGIVTSAHHPVRLALSPSLVPRDAIASAIALGAINFNLARLTGPALGGFIIATAGAPWALLLSALSFLPNLAVLPGLDPRTEGVRKHGGTVFSALGEGIRHAARTALIRRAMLAVGCFSLVPRALLEILPVLADGVFARGAAGLGALTAASGAGALVAASLFTLGPGPHPGRLPLSSRIAAPLGVLIVLVLAWNRSWPVALVLVTALGLCGTLVGVGLQSSVQLVLSDTCRARVMSLWTMVTIGGSAIGSILLGTLIDAFGLPTALSGAAGFALFGLAVLLATPLRRRRNRVDLTGHPRPAAHPFRHPEPLPHDHHARNRSRYPARRGAAR